jgi:hypothetical protein
VEETISVCSSVVETISVYSSVRPSLCVVCARACACVCATWCQRLNRMSIFVEFDARVIFKTLLRKNAFHENLLSDCHTLLTDLSEFLLYFPHTVYWLNVYEIQFRCPRWQVLSVMKIDTMRATCYLGSSMEYCPIWYHFVPIWVTFGAGCSQRNLSDCECRENWRIEGHTIWMKLRTRDLYIKLFRICKFRGKLSYGRKLNYVYSCTEKPYDISRVKDT